MLAQQSITPPPGHVCQDSKFQAAAGQACHTDGVITDSSETSGARKPERVKRGQRAEKIRLSQQFWLSPSDSSPFFSLYDYIRTRDAAEERESRVP